MEFSHIYPMDAVFDTVADVPEDVSEWDNGCVVDSDGTMEGDLRKVQDYLLAT